MRNELSMNNVCTGCVAEGVSKMQNAIPSIMLNDSQMLHDPNAGGDVVSVLPTSEFLVIPFSFAP